jgi:hypothetical protein
MEVTDRPDMGCDLKAPVEARHGANTPGYTLVSEMKEGDIVVHYDSEAQCIVGASRVVGPQYPQKIWWAPRGNYAAKAKEKPKWAPGIYVPIGDFTALPQPITRNDLIERHAAIFDTLETIKAEHPNNAIYYPFSPAYVISVWQSYSSKFPRALLGCFPELVPLVNALEARGPEADVVSEVDQALQDAAVAAGRPRSTGAGRGQGRRVDPIVRAAVEAHAMNMAREHYEALGAEVTDKSAKESYDFAVDINGEEWHIEVKGTQTKGESVLLSRNEVTHARTHPRTALFIVSEIVVTLSEDGVQTAGGNVQRFHPWDIEAGSLTPTGYEWTQPHL